ncbi:hypothetical protein ACMXYY_12570, partial [Acinetobacter courvalinii]
KQVSKFNIKIYFFLQAEDEIRDNYSALVDSEIYIRDRSQALLQMPKTDVQHDIIGLFTFLSEAG